MDISLAGSQSSSAFTEDAEYLQGPTHRAFVFGTMFSIPLWTALLSLVMT